VITANGNIKTGQPHVMIVNDENVKKRKRKRRMKKDEVF